MTMTNNPPRKPGRPRVLKNPVATTVYLDDASRAALVTIKAALPDKDDAAIIRAALSEMAERLTAEAAIDQFVAAFAGDDQYQWITESMDDEAIRANGGLMAAIRDAAITMLATGDAGDDLLWCEVVPAAYANQAVDQATQEAIQALQSE